MQKWIPIERGTLIRKEFEFAYDKCSQLMHAENPFATPKKLEEIYFNFREWLDKIIKLLEHHNIYLTNPDYLLNCQMNVNGKVSLWLFERQGVDGTETKVVEPRRSVINRVMHSLFKRVSKHGS